MYAYDYGSTPSLNPQQGKNAGSGSFGSFGNAQAQQKNRPRVNMGAALICLCVPVGVFTMVCGSLSSLFSVREDMPALAWTVVFLALAFALACTYLAVHTSWRRWAGQTSHEPFWHIFLAATTLAAWGSAFWLGELNWGSNVMPYVNLHSLSVRYDVDPATTSGQQLMDVGRVVFEKGTHLDLAKSMGFKNVDQYCVAPIVRGNRSVTSYDLWAIGLNCCSGNPAAFHCGEYSNPNARGGLRVMREDQRVFYQLAVQQAEAAFGVRSQHPLFFYWMEDPLVELETYKGDAKQLLLLGVLSFGALQSLLVLVGVLIRTKM